MKTNLFNALIELTSDWLIDVTIQKRTTGGFKLVFPLLLPSCCLSKLIAFCSLRNLDYYLSAADKNIEFQILK